MNNVQLISYNKRIDNHQDNAWSISGVVFLIRVIANLFPRAISHHRWYKNKFDNYPKNRKAIIPGII